MLFTPQEHPDNAPETWEVAKIGPRRWALRTQDGVTLQAFDRKRDAEAAKESGFYVTLYHKEGRWYAGEQVAGWLPFRDPVE